MAYKKFTDLFSGIAGTPALKQSLEQRVKTYADTFEKWVDAFDRVCPMRSIIDIDNQNMLPRADEIIRIAEQIGSIQSAADDAHRQLNRWTPLSAKYRQLPQRSMRPSISRIRRWPPSRKAQSRFG